MTNDTTIQRTYDLAREQYASLGVDTAQALAKLDAVSISLQCWQGDDVTGFEKIGGSLTAGGLAVTGGFPGRARTLEELRRDAATAFRLIPGNHRFNLHAMYGDFGGRPVDRDAILPEHFQGWIDWARERKVNLDFNSTCFAHPKAESGFTLSNRDAGIRRFWIDHVQRCRSISAFLGQKQGTPCIHDLWIPDGSKDITLRRWEHRAILKSALDEIFSTRFDPSHMKDAVESKLFGIGSESFVVGSHEFYLGYAVANRLMLCLDLGHFHPTESVGDKISAVMQYLDEILLHVSRGIRWDSDHVVILNDDVRSLAEEVVRANLLNRVHVALDFFDASINRVGAWVIGTRATQRGILLALLEPLDRLRALEAEGNAFARLALLEELKTMPAGAVWDYYCLAKGVPPRDLWIKEVLAYENDVLRKR